MLVGDELKLTVFLFDMSHRRVDRPIFFGSSNPTVATIDADAVDRAARPGEVSITAASEGKIAVLKLRVVDPAPCAFTLREDCSAEPISSCSWMITRGGAPCSGASCPIQTWSSPMDRWETKTSSTLLTR